MKEHRRLKEIERETEEGVWYRVWWCAYIGKQPNTNLGTSEVKTIGFSKKERF